MFDQALEHLLNGLLGRSKMNHGHREMQTKTLTILLVIMSNQSVFYAINISQPKH